MSDLPMKDLGRLDEATRTELNNPDLDLITDYVAGELDPAQVEAVSRRLEQDAQFRDFAAPILAAWGVAPHWQRFPMTRSEIEAGWDDFTRRAAFTHQRRKTRRRRLWILGIFVAVLVLPALLYSRELRTAFRDWRDYQTIPFDTGWIALRAGHDVRIEPGTRLRSLNEQARGVYRARLHGSAQFRVLHPDTAGMLPPMLPLVVETRDGVVFTGLGEFRVTTRRDTTEVEVLRPSKRRFMGFLPVPSTALVHTHADSNPIQLSETQRALLVRNGKAVRLPNDERKP
jgi:ferric-dicitrate binding protein FerR (iron transport regulator)